MGKRYSSATTFLWSQESSQRGQLNQGPTSPSHYLKWGVILLNAPEKHNKACWTIAMCKMFRVLAFTESPPTSTPLEGHKDFLRPGAFSKLRKSLQNSKIHWPSILVLACKLLTSHTIFFLFSRHYRRTPHKSIRIETLLFVITSLQKAQSRSQIHPAVISSYSTTLLKLSFVM